MFKREIWNKLTEFTFLEISKFQKMNEVNFFQNFTNKHVIPG